DHDDLVVLVTRLEIRDDPFERRRQPAGLVVCGNDDRELRGTHQGPPGEVTGHAGPVGHGAGAVRADARRGLRASDGASMKCHDRAASTSVGTKARPKKSGIEMPVPAACTMVCWIG